MLRVHRDDMCRVQCAWMEGDAPCDAEGHHHEDEFYCWDCLQIRPKRAWIVRVLLVIVVVHGYVEWGVQY